MEFEEIRKIWLNESQETVYVINEQALHNRIISKKKKTSHITNVSELMLITANFFGALFILIITFSKDSVNIFLYLISGWMLLTAIYVFAKRLTRLKRQNTFGLSMKEDLRFAVDTAGYQVQLSRLMRLNILPLALLCIIGIWNKQNMIPLTIGISMLFGITYYFSGWEHNFYKKRKYELEQLQMGLNQE